MSSQLIPANPADVLVVRDLTPNVTTLSVPFERYGRIHFGGRATVARLSGGGVLVFSPVALTAEVAAVVERLGGGQGVKYLVAGDMEHHIFLSEWLQAYPEARIVAPAGLREKRVATQGADPKVNIHDTFFAELPDGKTPVGPVSIAPDFDADCSLVYVDTHPNKELVVLYKPDRILIEADLLMNLPPTEQYSRVDAELRHRVEHPDLLNRIILTLMSTAGPAMGGRRLLWYGMSRGNRPRFNEAVGLIDTWDFDTIVPCHGETIVGDGKDVFRKMFAWHLPAKKDV